MKWTNLEVGFLKDNRMVLSFDELALCLNRTRISIKEKCKQLRLVRPKYYLELNMDSSLAYVLGCLCGDASIHQNGIRLSVKDEDFADEFDKHCTNLLTPYFIKIIRFKSKDVYHVMVGSLAFKTFIITKYGWSKTSNWGIHKEILHSDNKDVIRYFLKGYFDSEGNYNTNKIRIQTICPSLYDIGILLNKLNIHNKISIMNRKTKTGNTVYGLGIYGEKNINLFKKQIGFTIQRKQERLCGYLRKVNLTKQKTKCLRKNRKRIAKLYKGGYSLQAIADLFNIKSPCAITPYIKSVLGDDYNLYKSQHLTRCSA